MSACSPQRFLANNRNLLRTAILTPSSVLGVENKVIPLSNPRFGVAARQGNATVTLTGTYTGHEPADYDIQILDTSVDVARVSAPTSSGAGSGSVTDITAAGSPQTFVVECQSAGIQAAAASATIEGATVKATPEGTGGNATLVDVDRSGIVLTDTNFSLVADLEPGQGSSASPLVGQAFDWGTVALTNGLIPTTAQRIAFADDPARVYLNYKDYVDGEWQYYLIPSLTRNVPKGTRIQAVTGGCTVIVSRGATIETTATALPGGVVTAFDFLNWVRTESQLLVVTTPVPNDRSPTGLASREFALRTDAHADVSSGSGSTYATGFVGVTVVAGAGTQSVTAECIAATSADHPNARLGHTLWSLKSSLLGDLGIIAEGVPFTGAQFGLTIPVRLPPGYGEQKGNFSYEPPVYAPRVEGEEEPPICPVAMTLGPDAVDQTITLTWVARPTSGGCNCAGMPIPNLNPNCVGAPTEGGAAVAYQTDTNVKLKALRLWKKGVVRQLSTPGSATVSATEAPAIANPLDGVSGSEYPVVADDGSSASSRIISFNAAIPPDPPLAAGYETVAQGVPIAHRRTPADVAQYAAATESLNAVVNTYEQTIARIDPLIPASPPGYREAGMMAWDEAVTELQNDVQTAMGADSPGGRLLNIASSRYQASLDHALAAAGIPVVGGADASTVSGDGCWRDWDDSRYFSVESDVLGTLMPLFANHPYYASIQNANGSINSIHQFAMQLNIKCVDKLKLRDSMVFRIRGAGYGATYQPGDMLELPIIAAQSLAFTGGVNGAPIQTWTVHGSGVGPFAPYAFDPDNPVAYSGTVGGDSVGFLLVEGGIPPAEGDRFQWAVEGGHYQWRKNGGAWDGNSPPLSIPIDPAVLDAGLSVTFAAGASASFIAGDIFKFRATQPWAVSNLQRPTPAVWKSAEGSPDNATLESGDLGEIKQIDFFAMVHSLQEGAGAVLWGGADSDADDWSEPLTYRPDVIKKAMSQQARYLRIELTNVGGGAVQWAWAGVPVTTRLSADVQLTHSYQVSRISESVGGRFIGRGLSADVSWTEGMLFEDDAAALIAMLNHVKENDDEPLLFVPNVERDEVVFGRINADNVTFVDPQTYNQKAQLERRVSVSLAIESALL